MRFFVTPPLPSSLLTFPQDDIARVQVVVVLIAIQQANRGQQRGGV